MEVFKKDLSYISNQKDGSFQPSHFVQFYQTDSELLVKLVGFIEKGLKGRDTCIVVATKAHMRELDSLLLARGINALALQKMGQYVPLDAIEMLGKFMVNELPDRDLFYGTVGHLVELSVQKVQPLRIYGEMVAVLWKDGNKDAVLQLEQLWNELLRKHPCTLFCAYPELHFIMDRAVQSEISFCHPQSLSLLAT